MRPELKEYNLDWMLASILSIAANLGNGTEKEWRNTIRYYPYFSGIVEPILNHGSVGASFLKLLSRSLNDIINARENGKKVVLTTFCMNTAIFHAMDITPVMLEVMTAISSLLFKRGATEYMDYCVELGFPDTGCSSQRGTLGAYLAGMGVDIDLVAVNMPGICDNNANAYAFAAEYLKKPFYALNYPAELVGPEARAYHRDDFKGLIAFLEEQTGNRLDVGRLEEILDEYKRQDALLSHIEDMMRLVPNPVPGIFNLFFYVGRWLYGGFPIYTELLQEMVAAIEKNIASGRAGIYNGEEKLRAFFFYIDNFALNARMWQWFDTHGISILGSILSRYFPDNSPYLPDMEAGYTIDTTHLDAMIDTVAEMNARNPMTRTIRGPYDAPYMWLEDTLSLAGMYKADCCIYSATPGCRNTWSNVKLITKDIEKHGYPVHIVHADGFDARVESWQKTAEQLEEFFTVRNLFKTNGRLK